MSLFDNRDQEEFLLLTRNFKMTLAALGTLETGEKVQFLRTLVSGKVLCQFELLYYEVERWEVSCECKVPHTRPEG